MKQLKFIFLLLILLLVFPARSTAQSSAKAEPRYAICGYDLSKGISELADHLRECRFEVPQTSGNIAFKRNGEQQTSKRIHTSKPGTSGYVSQKQKEKEPQPASCRKAIATVRHARGYYIYALRHIII